MISTRENQTDTSPTFTRTSDIAAICTLARLGWAGTPAVHVEDPSTSCVSVFFPMNLEEGWIDEQRRLLGRVLKEWPNEVLQSSPGVYEWRR